MSHGYRFTLGLGFGHTLHRAVTNLFQSLGTPFARTSRDAFSSNGIASVAGSIRCDKTCGDEGELYRRSCELLLAHEDKNYPGAMIASLSIPWGEIKGDEDLGGYHLVWTRDMVNSATGLLAAGDTATRLCAR